MISSFIGYSHDQNIRFNATSGGIGSSLLKYLFETNEIQTAVSFNFIKYELKYKPRLIYSFEDYKITGSIYHEINMFQFIKENINLIKGKLLLFLLPCQVKPVQAILKKNNIENLIISLTCSSQQSIEATYFLLKTLSIDKKKVELIKYRGEGWPGGVNIQLHNNKNIFIPNNNSIWTEIFHSRIFIQKRCFKCNETISDKADICLADPWLKYYSENEKRGQSLVVVNTNEGLTKVNEAFRQNIIFIEEIANDCVIKSQQYTIDRKMSYLKQNRLMSLFMKIINSYFYRSVVLSHIAIFKLHCKIKNRFEHLILRKSNTLTK